MSPPSTDVLSPAQGLAGDSYDQSLKALLQARLRTRRRIGQRRRIAAYARLTMAVQEGRRLSDAEVRDLMAVQPSVVVRGSLLRELVTTGKVEEQAAWVVLARLWEERDGRQLDLPLAANQDGGAAP